MCGKTSILPLRENEDSHHTTYVAGFLICTITIIQWQRADHRLALLRFFCCAQKRHREGPGDCSCVVSATPSRSVANLWSWQYTTLMYAIVATVPPLILASRDEALVGVLGLIYCRQPRQACCSMKVPSLSFY